MKAQLKNIDTSDINIDTYYPEDEKCFGFYIEAIIGPDSEKGGDIFGFQICSPKWLLLKHSETDVIFCHNMIIVFEYDFNTIKQKISDLCNKTAGENWNDIAQKIAKFGAWEYENYQG